MDSKETIRIQVPADPKNGLPFNVVMLLIGGGVLLAGGAAFAVIFFLRKKAKM